jgi:hypothetical protein
MDVAAVEAAASPGEASGQRMAASIALLLPRPNHPLLLTPLLPLLPLPLPPLPPPPLLLSLLPLLLRRPA